VGSGFRTFTAGEVLTASNVQNYLMDQSVMVFGGSAARSSAIGTANFEEGMVSYLTDTDKVEAYNGTNWVSVAPTTSQGLTLINTTSFSGVSSVSPPAATFSSTYLHYKAILDVTGVSTGLDFRLRLRNAGSDITASNYFYYALNIPFSGATALVQGQTTFAVVSGMPSNNHNSQVQIDFYRPNENSTTGFNMLAANNDAGGGQVGGGTYRTAQVADSFTILTSTGTFTGSVSVYGYSK
jgi:hypothetical protein